MTWCGRDDERTLVEEVWNRNYVERLGSGEGARSESIHEEKWHGGGGDII